MDRVSLPDIGHLGKIQPRREKRGAVTKGADIRADAGQGGAICDLGQGKGQAKRGQNRRVGVGFHLCRGQAQGPRHQRNIGGADLLQRNGGGKPGLLRCGMGVQRPNAQFQHHVRAMPRLRQRHSGADGRMPGKGNFCRWSENADFRSVGGIVRRIHKGGFREIEFTRDPLQRRFRQPGGIGDYSQLVAAKWLIGEHVQNKVSGHPVGSSGSRPTLAASLATVSPCTMMEKTTTR